MELLEKLEEVKQLGAYSLNFSYGEGTGCDDNDIPVLKRSVRFICEPVGYLGSMRAYYHGTVESFLEQDFSEEPTIVSNPPKKEDMKNPGLYCWGSDSAIEEFNTTKKLFPFSN